MQPTHSSRRILLPANPWFILASLLGALALNLAPTVPLPGFPDWVALVLAFWCIREPLKVGMTTAFLMGLLMDVANAAIMGQHALAYVLLAYSAGALSRRVLWFSLPSQALHVLPLLLGVQVLMVLVRLLGGAAFPGWSYFAGSLSAAVLWIPLTYVLLLPQFQPIDRDENRPI